MSTVSYANREEMDKAIAGVVEETSNKEVATSSHYKPIEGGSGDFDINDIEIPYLAIVGGNGALSRDRRFHAGDIVLMKEFMIPQPARMTVFAFRNYFVQNLKYEEGVRPASFPTKEAVIASGGNFDERKEPGSDPNNFVRAGELTVAIELPQELGLTIPGVLDFETGDPGGVGSDFKYVARAKWSVKGSNYKSIIRRLNLIEGPLKLKNKTIATVFGDVTTANTKKGDFWVQVADFAMKGQNSQAYLDFLRSVF